MPAQVSNNPVRTVGIPSRGVDDVSASLEPLKEWLDKVQDAQTKIILLNSTKDNIYSFEVSFNFFVLDGDIDLATNEIANGTFYVTAPVWGRVNMADDVEGDLDGSITVQFNRGPNITGKFTLTLDKKDPAKPKLTIKYDFFVKFVGSVSDTISLFVVPPSTKPPTAKIAEPRPTLLEFNTYTDDHKLFDSFLDEHLDPNTKNIVIESYKPPVPGPTGVLAAGSKAYTVNVSFLGIFELEGSIDTSTLTLSATLYVRVPLWGRVKVISISGNLREGIKLSVNVLVASGTIGLRLDGKDVRFLVDLDVKFVGKIKDDIKLFTLPF